MKAKFIEFNSEWYKDCSKCGTHFGASSLHDLSQFFTRDKNKPDGFDYSCKICKREHRLENKDKESRRWKMYYAPGTKNRKRHIVRSQTRRKFGSAKNWECGVCRCPAEEWHHVEYVTDGAVPLCQKCHQEITSPSRAGPLSPF